MPLKVFLIVLFSTAVQTFGHLGACALPGHSTVCWAGDGVVECIYANAETQGRWVYHQMSTKVPITPGTPIAMACDPATMSGGVAWTTKGQIHGLGNSAAGEGYAVLFSDPSISAGTQLGACALPGHSTICAAGDGVINCIYANADTKGQYVHHQMTTKVPITEGTPIAMACDPATFSGGIAWTTKGQIHGLGSSAAGEAYSVLFEEASLSAGMKLGACALPGHGSICAAGDGVIDCIYANAQTNGQYVYHQMTTKVPITKGIQLAMACDSSSMSGGVTWATEGKIHGLASDSSGESYGVLYTGDVPVATDSQSGSRTTAVADTTTGTCLAANTLLIMFFVMACF